MHIWPCRAIAFFYTDRKSVQTYKWQGKALLVSLRGEQRHLLARSSNCCILNSLSICPIERAFHIFLKNIKIKIK